MALNKKRDRGPALSGDDGGRLGETELLRAAPTEPAAIGGLVTRHVRLLTC
ncbi:MAG: hypothetical protein ACLPVY_09615 [Acidimicrobiia bacterium]